MPMRLSILGVPIDAVTRSQALDIVRGFLRSGAKHHIATPNPEMLVAAHRNSALKTVLQNTALNIPDGQGILWAAKRKGVQLPERVTGTDLLVDVCALPDIGPVFLLGAWEGTAEKAAEALRQKNPALSIAGTFSGSPRAEEEQEIVDRINKSGAQILFVAYGVPGQELWIARNLVKMPAVTVAMGVGGAFDFAAGIHKRAPTLLRAIGLEWLWRLILQPSRLPRIFNAVIVFPWLILRFDR